MKITTCLLAACLALPLWTATAAETPPEEKSEVLSQKELRELLKDQKNLFNASVLIFAMKQEEQEKLRSLYRDDREAARKFVLDKLEESKQWKQKSNQQIQQLARDFRQSKDKEEKAKLRQQLRQMLTEQYNRTSEEISDRLKMQEQRLNEVRRGYRSRIENADRAIDSQLEKLTHKQPQNRKKRMKEAADE